MGIRLAQNFYRSLGVGLFIGIGLAFLPLGIQGYWLHVVMEIIILALFATSLNLVVGYTGMISFGHAGFYGIGLYVVAGLLKGTSLPLAAVLTAAALSGALAGLIIGFLSVRLRAFYFAILTLAFGQLIWAVIFKWHGVTGGEDGIIGIPIPAFLSGKHGLYYFILAISACGIGLLYWLTNTPFGRMLSAIRENPERTECVGVNVDRYRLLAFVLSTFFSGLAGGLYCLLSGGAFPDLVSWTKSGEVLLACVLGGMFTFLGPALGSVFMILLESLAQSFFTERWPLILGAVFILVALGLPQGVLGTIQQKMSFHSNNKG
ncbi:MAG: branched-chain amino acid ABC transporter permease [Thermodesulfobacteriota bacterium]